MVRQPCGFGAPLPFSPLSTSLPPPGRFTLLPHSLVAPETQSPWRWRREDGCVRTGRGWPGRPVGSVGARGWGRAEDTWGAGVLGPHPRGHPAALTLPPPPTLLAPLMFQSVLTTRKIIPPWPLGVCMSPLKTGMRWRVEGETGRQTHAYTTPWLEG